MSRKGLQAQTAAALDGLVQGLEAATDAAGARLVLMIVGEAVRLGVPLPPPLSTWLRTRSADQLAGALRILDEELAQLTFPVDADDDDEAFDALERAVAELDRAHSTQLGVVRACVAAHLAPAQVEGYASVVASLTSAVKALCDVAERDTIEDALGDRRTLIDDRSWLAGQPDGSERADDLLDEEQLAAAPRPPDQVLTSYLQHGRHARWVEGLMDRQPDLEECVGILMDELETAGEALSLKALARRASRSRGAAVVKLEGTLAAADRRETAPEETIVRLGSLAPVDAEAILVRRGGTIELRVFGPAVRSVRVAGTEARRDAAATGWVAALTSPTEPFALRVEGPHGELFETQLVIETVSR